jgi:HAD superfamily hydrolase (TIGR01549 family)
VPEPVVGGTIRAVVFDVDGTLYHQSPLRRAMAVRLVRAHALRPWSGWRTMRIISAYRHAQESMRDDAVVGDLHAAQIDAAATRTGADPADVARCIARWMDDEPLQLLGRYVRQGMSELLDDLRARGVRLAVLSDYPAEAKLTAMGLAGKFDAVLCAQDPEIGVFKPDPHGILVALDRLGVAPGAAMYVGDRVDVDAVAAHAAGVACVILTEARIRQQSGESTLLASLSDLSKRLETV